MSARVGDFELARQTREGQSHLMTRVIGTHVYLVPEYMLSGQLTVGVVVLEIMSGRMAQDVVANKLLVTDWA